MRSQEQIDAAVAIVNNLRDKGVGTVWQGISYETFANSLVARINDPVLVSSDETNMCGPAAFVRLLAENNPEAYARMGINLYQTGRTVLESGRLAGLPIAAGADLRNHPVPNTTKPRPDGTVEGLDPANWVTIASMRDSDNWWFDYQHQSDAVAGMTLPHTMEKWLGAAGFHTIIPEANVWITKDRDHAVRANKLFRQGFKVTLFISANMLYSRDTSTGVLAAVGNFFAGADEQEAASWTPNHWVGMVEEIKFIGGVAGRLETVECKVHSWGQHMPVPADPSHPLKTKDFLQNYYGFIACKY